MIVSKYGISGDMTNAEFRNSNLKYGLKITIKIFVPHFYAELRNIYVKM